MTLPAGKLNRRITVQQASSTQDAYGQPLPSGWTDVLTTWAGIRAATSKEVYAASGFTSQLSHVITVRYQPSAFTYLSGMRIAYRGRTFQLQAVADPDEDRVKLNLLCLEVMDGKP